jgi:hypothetical protein
MRVGNLIIGRDEGIAGDLDLARMDDLLAVEAVAERAAGPVDGAQPVGAGGHQDPHHRIDFGNKGHTTSGTGWRK